jgi:hypothetical protein
LDVPKLLWKVLRDQDDHGVAARGNSCTTRRARERKERERSKRGRSLRKRKRRKGEGGVVYR